jgi:hypothetical protein
MVGSGFPNTYVIFNEESTDDYFRVADYPPSDEPISGF